MCGYGDMSLELVFLSVLVENVRHNIALKLLVMILMNILKLYKH